MRFLLQTARVCASRPRACLALLGLLTLALGSRLPLLELETDGAALRPALHPATLQDARDRITFRDREELILVLTAPPGGPCLASPAGLETLGEVHRGVASLPGVRSAGVRSALSLVDVAASGIGSLATFSDALSTALPGGDGAVQEVLDRMRRHPWTDGLFLSVDGRAAALYVPLEPGGDRRRRVAAVEEWVAARSLAPLELRLTGPAVAETVLGARILEDLGRLVPVMVGVVALLLLAGLRAPGGLLVAMAKILVVLVWTGGGMALAGVPVTLVTTILPVLLMALCVTDEVHLLVHLQGRLAPAAAATEDAAAARRGAVLATLDDLYRPVVFTSLSTAVGLLSFLSASIVPLRHFGALAATGILVAMLMSFSLTPALVACLPTSWFLRRGRDRPAEDTGPADRLWRLGGRRRRTLFLCGVLLLAAAAPGLSRLTVQDSWIDNFDPASPLVRAEREFNRRFWGTYRLDLVLTGEPGSFHGPQGASLVADLSASLEGAPRVGGVVTYLDSLDLVADLLGLPSGAATLPEDALGPVVAVGAAYPESRELRRLVTADGRSARLLVLVRNPDYQGAAALVEEVRRETSSRLRGTGLSFHLGGDLPQALATVDAIVGNQVRSIGWTLCGIAVLLLLANRQANRLAGLLEGRRVDRRVRLTLVQLVPPVAAVFLVLGLMGYAGIALGIATSMFAALALGVGVDLALHATYAFERHRARGRSPEEALRRSFAETEGGRWWSTVVLSVGFLVLTLSAFGPNHLLGLLLSAAMAASYLATSLLLPWTLAP